MPERTTPPPGRSFRLVLLTTFAAFCVLYAPQPLLPQLAHEFDVDATSISLLMTVVFVFLALAPIAFGALLRRTSAQRLLLVSTAALGLLQIAFAAAPSFFWLLTARGLQGALLPAIFTAAVTYCSRAGSPDAIARRVSIYVATTIMGGLAGRLISGYANEAVGWRFTFAGFGLLLLICSVSMMFVDKDSRVGSARSSLGTSLQILSQTQFRAGFALILLVFFVFSGSLNVLPFRLVELNPQVPSSRISLVYIGYLIGIVIALNSATITRISGSPVRTMSAGLALFTFGMALMWAPSVNALIAIGFLTSAGMFTMHSTLSGYLNKLQPDDASMVNGLYISVYYAAGVLGSVLPILIYQSSGWLALVAASVGVCTLAIAPLWTLKRYGH